MRIKVFLKGLLATVFLTTLLTSPIDAAASKDGMDARVAELARDIAAKVSIRKVFEKAVGMGMKVDEAVGVVIKAGAEPSAAVYTAITEGYSIHMTVNGAIKAGVSLNMVVNAAFAAGANAETIAGGAMEAGMSPEIIASVISESFGLTQEVQPISTYGGPSSNIVISGGGATASTETASPSKP